VSEKDHKNGGGPDSVALDEAEKRLLSELEKQPLLDRVGRLERHDLALIPKLAAEVALGSAAIERQADELVELRREARAQREATGSPRVERTEVRAGGRESIVIEPATGLYLDNEKTRAICERALKVYARQNSRWTRVGNALAVVLLAVLLHFAQRLGISVPVP
jgi:hypothetical protein